MNLIPLKPGFSVEGDEIQGFKTEQKNNRYIYLMAGVHGDEVEGVYILKQLLDWIESDEGDEIQLPMVIIPILNIDGYRGGTRTNSHEVDLNRNLPSENWTKEAREKKYHPGPNALSEPENQFLNKLFNKYPPAVILTFHSWKPLLNYNGDDCLKIAQLLARYNSYQVVADIEGHPTPGSLGEYAPEKFNAQVLTFEAPLIQSGKSLKEIWSENENGLKTLIKSDLLLEFVKQHK